MVGRFLLYSLLLFALPATVRAADEGCSGVLSGTVTDVQTLEPVARARVSVRTDRDRWGETDAAGRYLIQDLCPGMARVEVTKAGYREHLERFEIQAGPNRHDFYLLTGTVDAVTVEGKARDEAERSARATEVLGADALRRQRGQDLAHSLESLPGVRVLGSGAVSKPIVNGLSADRLLILQEGVRLESQDWSLDHAPEVDAFGAERVVVTKGAATVRYGPKAIGGVLSLEPALYPDQPGRVEGEGTGVAIANGRGGAANASVRTRLSETWAARVQSSYRRVGALDSPRYVLDNTGQEEIGLTAGVEWSPNDALRLELSGRLYRTTYGLFRRIRDTEIDSFLAEQARDLPSGVERFSFDYDFDRPFIEVGHDQVKLELEWTPSKRLRLKSFYAFQTDDRREFDTVRGPLRDAAQAALSLDTHSVATSLELSSERFVVEPGVLLTAQRNDYEGVPFIPDYTRLGVGAYLIGRYLRPRWEAEAGVRVDYQNYDNTLPGRTADQPATERTLDFLAFTGSAGAIFDLGDDWSFRGQVATASRNPSPPELFADGATIGLPGLQVGDSDLDLEYALNAQGTLRLLRDRFRLELTGYVHNFFNYIFLAPRIDENGEPIVEDEGVGFLPQFTFRQTDARFWGFDGALHAEAGVLGFDTRAAVVRARDLGRDEFLIYVPADRFSQRITFGLPDGPQVHDTFLYAEGAVTLRQTRFDLAADFTPPPEQYVLLNLGAGVTFDIAGQELILDLEVRNATNARYRDYLSRLRYYADEPGVQAFLRVSVPFSFGGREDEETNP